MAVGVTFRNASAKVTLELVTEVCCTCGVVFAMTEDFNKQRQRTGEWFYCPAGHPQHYLETEAAKLQRQLDEAKRLKEISDRRADNAFERLETERKSHASTKGQLTKTRNRIQSGHCPECHQFFGQLKRHMESEHPATDLQEALGA